MDSLALRGSTPKYLVISSRLLISLIVVKRAQVITIFWGVRGSAYERGDRVRWREVRDLFL